MKFVKEVLPYIIIIGIVILIRTFIITPVRVDGDSMNPNYEDGDILLLKKFDKDYKRFDVVVFYYNNEKLIKRIIGLPGDVVKYMDNKLYINGVIYEDVTDVETAPFITRTVPEDSYFVLGDNRINSKDSRVIGFINKDLLTGKVIYRLFPFSKFGKLKTVNDN